MNTPLNDLKQWFLALESTGQHNLGVLIDHFSPKTPDTFKKRYGYNYRFLSQLEAAQLDANAIIQKTLYFIKVIDFCVDGCSKEENWLTRLDILLETHDEYTKKEMPEIADEMLNQFHELRNSWLAVAKSWSEITNGLLSNDTINKWYIQELIKAVRG